MDLISVYLVVICVCCFVHQSDLFNIDVKTAKIFRGNPGTGFGFTAEFIHHRSSSIPSLLVGAPNETSTDIDRSGIHHYCPVISGLPCERMFAPPQLLSPIRDGRFGEQYELFGMALTMANDTTAVMCGPMWSDMKWWNQGYDFNIGRCQFLPPFGKDSEGVTPYRDSGLYIANIELDGRSARHTYYGRAEFGFSADGDGKGRVVIGSPGFSVSRGGLVVLDTRFKNYTMMKKILDSEPDIVLGYAVATGNFCGPDRFCFVASNRQVQGKVFLLEHEGSDIKPLWVKREQEKLRS